MAKPKAEVVETDLLRAAEKAPSSSFEDKIAAAVAKAMETAIPMAFATIEQVRSNAQTAANEKVQANNAAVHAVCPECRFHPKNCDYGKSHKKVVVFPKSGANAQWFQGVTINGVRLLSNGPGHYLIVPERCDVEGIVARWEANEEETKQGRSAQHHSGSIGAGHSQVHPAHAAWR